MAVRLTTVERDVLAVAAAEPDAWLNSFYVPIIEVAGGDWATAAAACASLRRRKLLDGEGRGKFAQYGINDAGRAALAATS